MRLYIDIDSKRLITSPGSRSEIKKLEFKRGDSGRVEVQFTRGTTIQELSGTTINGILGFKESGKYDQADFISGAVTWTKEGTGTDTLYVFEPSFNVDALNLLLKSGDLNDTNDIKSVTLMGEIEWIIDGKVNSTQEFESIVYNDVIKGSEGTPTSLPTPDDFVAARAVLYDRPQSLSPTEKTQVASNVAGAADGQLAALAAGGKFPPSVMPVSALTTSKVVADSTARLALSSADATGFVVVEADTGESYMLIDGGNPSVSGDWVQVGDRDINASDINDSTTAGRDMLTAASQTDQRGLLGVQEAKWSAGKREYNSNIKASDDPGFEKAQFIELQAGYIDSDFVLPDMSAMEHSVTVLNNHSSGLPIKASVTDGGATLLTLGAGDQALFWVSGGAWKYQVAVSSSGTLETEAGAQAKVDAATIYEPLAVTENPGEPGGAQASLTTTAYERIVVPDATVTGVGLPGGEAADVGRVILVRATHQDVLVSDAFAGITVKNGELVAFRAVKWEVGPGLEWQRVGIDLESQINNATELTTLADDDKFGVTDTSASGAWKWVSTLNIYNYIKAILDGALTLAGAKTFTGQLELTGQSAIDDDSAMTVGLADNRYDYNSFPRWANLPPIFDASFESGANASAPDGKTVSGSTVTPSQVSVISTDGNVHLARLQKTDTSIWGGHNAQYVDNSQVKRVWGVEFHPDWIPGTTAEGVYSFAVGLGLNDVRPYANAANLLQSAQYSYAFIGYLSSANSLRMEGDLVASGSSGVISSIGDGGSVWGAAFQTSFLMLFEETYVDATDTKIKCTVYNTSYAIGEKGSRPEPLATWQNEVVVPRSGVAGNSAANIVMIAHNNGSTDGRLRVQPISIIRQR